MGIEVPETYWAYHKCNKAFSDIYHLVGFSSLRLYEVFTVIYLKQTTFLGQYTYYVLFTVHLETTV